MDENDRDPPSHEASADEDMIVPGNNRAMQARRAPRRKLFGARRKETFLEHLSCTANVAASAAAAGVSEGCVYAHRRADPEFREAFWMALEQGVAKLVALRLQREVERAEGRGNGDSCEQLSPLELRLDGPPDEKQILDLIKLMQALRDLCRNLSVGTKPGRPRHAELDEVCAALAKRLKAFPPTPDEAPASADKSAFEAGSFETGFDKLNLPQDEREGGEVLRGEGGMGGEAGVAP